MRIISGQYKGRRLKIKGGRIRPTSDRVREAVFNILHYDFNDTSVLDLYAGTGALGIEALSRGARRAVFVDSGREAAKVIKENLETLCVGERARLITKKAAPALKLLNADGEKFHMVFMDPPYRTDEDGKLLSFLAGLDVLESGAVVIVEHDASHELSEEYGSLKLQDRRKYGRTAVSFYLRREEP